MRLKQSRAASFAALAAIYLFAAALGIELYRFLPFNFKLNLLFADIAATVFVFVFSVVLNNASVYDPYWSVQPIVILTAFALDNPLTPTRLLPLIAVILWGLRLTANWAYTFKGLEHQDWRYTQLNQQTGKAYPIVNFIGIHLVPTLVVYACVLPAVCVYKSEAEMNIGGVLFFLLSISAALLQGISDLQMHRFRKAGGGGFIREGLWKYSRHPNYLGEILMWWGVGLAAVSVLGGRWLLLTGAVLNTCLFFFVSIPLAEKRQSAKPGFEEYKAQTHMLLPISK